MRRNLTSIVNNKVFIGCPWKTIRPKYLKIVEECEKRYPINFILIGRETDQRAEELLGLIKKHLLSSTAAIFDVTGGNANVSLEYGIADASEIERVIYLNIHERNRSNSKDNPIIADLAGQKRKQWTNERSLRQLINEFCRNHNFTKRFEDALRKATKNSTRHKKKSYRSLGLKIIHVLNEKDSIKRNDIVEKFRAQGYKEDEIEFLLKKFNQLRLIHIPSGRYSDVSIS